MQLIKKISDNLRIDPIFLHFVANLFITFVGFMLILFCAVVIEWVAKRAEEDDLLPNWCIAVAKFFAGLIYIIDIIGFALILGLHFFELFEEVRQKFV
jgi:uncharacterized membrane protein